MYLFLFICSFLPKFFFITTEYIFLYYSIFANNILWKNLPFKVWNSFTRENRILVFSRYLKLDVTSRNSLDRSLRGIHLFLKDCIAIWYISRDSRTSSLKIIKIKRRMSNLTPPRWRKSTLHRRGTPCNFLLWLKYLNISFFAAIKAVKKYFHKTV